MKKVVIIGAGVSGLVCAIESKTKNNEVILLEKEDEVGKKILASGSGKCNYYNEDISLDKYHSTYKKIEDYLEEKEYENRYIEITPNIVNKTGEKIEGIIDKGFSVIFDIIIL